MKDRAKMGGQMTLTHAVTNGVRHPRSTSVDLIKRAAYSARALTERRAGDAYRAQFGTAGFSPAQVDAMWADPSCPVQKRHRPGV